MSSVGGFERLPSGLLDEIASWLQPRDWLAGRDMQPVSFQQLSRMAVRMWLYDCCNHEAMVCGRDVLSFVGCCRWLRDDPIGGRTLVFQRELHYAFIAECIALEMEEQARLPAFEIRALEITAARMAPALGRRHVMEQCRLRRVLRERGARFQCDWHVVQAAQLDAITGEPLPGRMENVETADGWASQLV